MSLETGTYISDLVVTNPTGADAKSTTDDHLRLIKSAIKATFAAITGAVTATHTELNRLVGITGNVQTQLDAKAPLVSAALTGTPTAPTANIGTNTTQIANMAALQAGIANANAQAATVVNVVTGTSVNAVAGQVYALTNAAVSTVILPSAPNPGDLVGVIVSNNIYNNLVSRNGKNIQGLAEDLIIDSPSGAVYFRYISPSGWFLSDVSFTTNINGAATIVGGSVNSSPIGATTPSTGAFTSLGATSLTLQGATSTAGTGVAFPATQLPSTDPNTLDDYEEGTWTPNQGAGLTVVGAFSSTGTYTKIGRQVTVFGSFVGATSISCSAFGTMCTNLPFSVGTAGVGVAVNSALSVVGAAYATSGTTMVGSAFSASANITFTCTYFV